MLRIDPDPAPDQPWWSIRHARIGDRPAWSMRFDARTPVEIIAAFTDALSDPTAAADPAVDPYETLRLAGWRDGHDHDGLTSPDGIAMLSTSRRAAPTAGSPRPWSAKTPRD
ncbi:DUF317 domain-containing protein [Streptomyces sp. NPDC058989]|uniref:DUF317 domain-containing protein n=1 Tax=Streptomyces sp. NPDC058989 TaxID=3346686 RepID=UPI0036C08210